MAVQGVCGRIPPGEDLGPPPEPSVLRLREASDPGLSLLLFCGGWGAGSLVQTTPKEGQHDFVVAWAPCPYSVSGLLFVCR